jgi:formate dehydrogenase subunit gamma
MASPQQAAASTPVASTLAADARERVVSICRAWRDKPGALLPILHAVQNALGYVPKAAVPVIANELNQSRAEVHGMLSFYHYFRTEPAGRHVVYLCRAEACQSMGSRALEAQVRKRLGIGFHDTTADGAFTLEPVYCLGNCACSPSLMIDADLHGRVDAERFEELLVEYGGTAK